MSRSKKKSAPSKSNSKNSVKKGKIKKKPLSRKGAKAANKAQQKKDINKKVPTPVQKTEKTDAVKEWIDDNSKSSPKKSRKELKEQKGSLRERMMERLQGAHFRYLNEQLYTAQGNQSNKLFSKNPEAFEAYHTGFQKQVQHWEFNPLDLIIANLKKKPETLIVADFGCGDARLAQSVPNKVHSFDLVAMNEHVTACDMSNTPLANGTVDVAVFCLSLMGTNLADFFLEANRVLKVGGTLKIAEVESRFEGEKGLGSFIYSVTKYGFKLTNKNLEKTYFYFIDFKKTESVAKKKGLPALSLKPCIYKKR